jgi:cell division protein ZapA
MDSDIQKLVADNTEQFNDLVDKIKTLLNSKCKGSFDDKKELTKLREKLAAAEKKVDDAEKRLEEAKYQASDAGNKNKVEFETATKSLDDATKKLTTTEKELEEAKKELEKAKTEVDTIKKELEEAQQELKKAQQELKDAASNSETAKNICGEKLTEMGNLAVELYNNIKKNTPDIKSEPKLDTKRVAIDNSYDCVDKDKAFELLATIRENREKIATYQTEMIQWDIKTTIEGVLGDMKTKWNKLIKDNLGEYKIVTSSLTLAGGAETSMERTMRHLQMVLDSGLETPEVVGVRAKLVKKLQLQNELMTALPLSLD